MKIFCLGDSNTYGYDPRSYFGGRYPAQYRWVDLLAKRLGCETINGGENGRKIPKREEELLRFECMLTSQSPVDLLIVVLGTNDLLQGDSAEAVAARMESFLGRIALDKSRILVIGPPPVQPGEWVSSQELIDASIALNREYKGLSERLGVEFADAGEWDISLAFDGVHFTEEGHRIFAQQLAAILPDLFA